MLSELEVQEKTIPEMLAKVKGLSPSEPGMITQLMLILTRLSSIKSNRDKDFPKRLFTHQITKHKISEIS